MKSKEIGWLIIGILLFSRSLSTCPSAFAQSSVRISVDLYRTKSGARDKRILNMTKTVPSQQIYSVGIRWMSDALVERVKSDTKSLPDNAPRTVSYKLSELESGDYNGKPRPERMEIKSFNDGTKYGELVSGKNIPNFLSGLRENTTYTISRLFLHGYSSETVSIRRSGGILKTTSGGDTVTLTQATYMFSVLLNAAGESNVVLPTENIFLGQLNAYMKQKNSAMLTTKLDGELATPSDPSTGPYRINSTKASPVQGSQATAKPFPDYIAVIGIGS